ncbi:CDP-diacylglycerol--serine O-phosphatidyltransferase [uncultured Candidatus Thioglobus sp.]|nr:CDP-diacylglycerol--serine O-phosphatidyltransferase [uncultured Candidatus Thioglobus sp.]
MNRRGTYLLPNLLTTAGLFAGFYSIASAMNAEFEIAAIAIFIAIVMDSFDGPIARFTNTQTNFGMEYDSLSDMVSFGVAPPILMYTYILHDIGKLGWLATFVYTVATALRLARFNTQPTAIDKRFFQGLPSPAAAALLAGGVWVYEVQNYASWETLKLLSLSCTIMMGVLMVSNIRFYKHNINFNVRIPVFATILLVLIFIFIATEPAIILFTLSLIYIFSGLAITLFSMRKYRLAKQSKRSPKD